MNVATNSPQVWRFEAVTVGKDACIQNAGNYEDASWHVTLLQINAIPTGGRWWNYAMDSSDARAQAQGYWIEYGSTPPTETTKYELYPGYLGSRFNMSQPIPVSASPPSSIADNTVTVLVWSASVINRADIISGRVWYLVVVSAR